MENQTNEIKAVRVITHNGAFHADEVFAVALLDMILEDDDFKGDYKPLMIERTKNLEKITKYKKEYPETFILGVGGKYDPIEFCFDHHHDRTMPATNVLLFDFLVKVGKLSFISEDKRVLDRLRSFQYGISDFDKNKSNILGKWRSFGDIVFGEVENQNRGDVFYRNINDIISGFNRDVENDGEQMRCFRLAIHFAKTVLENEIYNAKQYIKSLDEIYNSIKFDDTVLVVFSKYNMVWKNMKDKNFGITTPKWCYAIMPNDDGYMLLTVNSKNCPLPSIIDVVKVTDELIGYEGNIIMTFKTEESAKKVYNELLKIEF